MQDRSLEGVAAVLLDEFQERSVEADLALTLCLDCQKRLRPDLRCSRNARKPSFTSQDSPESWRVWQTLQPVSP